MSPDHFAFLPLPFSAGDRLLRLRRPGSRWGGNRGYPLQALARKGLALIASGKRVIITEAGIGWLDDNGWSIR
jgi:hypothetical protein